MIVKSFELEKIVSLNLNTHLIYGNNEGIKLDIINNYYKKNHKGEILKYDEQDILTNKDEFISNLLNKSLFENEKLIIISRGTDKLTTVINEVLDRKEIAAKVISKSSNLEKKSKLRNYNNCIFGSHNASNTTQAVERASFEALDILNKLLLEKI